METQKRQLFYILSLLTVLISCTQNDRNDNKQVSETVFAVNVDTLATHANNQNLVKLRSDSFVRSILDTNTLDWTFRPNDNNTPKYVKLFKQDGIKTIYAYSNKEYPQKSKASSYEHFVLFLLEYQDKASAVSAFDRFTSDTENFDIDKKQVNDSTYERISHIYFLSKYGGLVGRKENFIISLVETCGGPGPYKSDTWPAYEKNFIESIFDISDSSLTFLNADCGGMKYKIQKIKK